MAKETKTTKKEVKTVKAAKVTGVENPMKKIRIERVVISAGGIEKELEKSKKLLEIIAGRKSQVIISQKRIPDFGVKPGLEVGVRITLRGNSAVELLRRLLGAIDNKLKAKQMADNHFSFGIEEYIEIPGMEYQRDIGIKGLNVTVVFARPGLRVLRKKIKQGHVPKRQRITKQEIINFMEDNFKTKIQ